MKPSLLPPGPKPPSRAAARNAALVNQLATPGLGSLMAGRWVAGLGQLAAAVAGFVMLVVWFFEIMFQYYGQVTGGVQVRPVGWVGAVGLILFAASWFWALVTSLSLLRQARADEPVESKPVAAPVADSVRQPPKLS